MGNSLPSSSPIAVAIIVIASAGAVLVIYHFIVLRCCNRTETISTHGQMPQTSLSLADHFGQDLPGSSSLEDSITELIPIHKFSRDLGLVSQSEDGTCSICLCEFKDGEAIRILPECLHPFHVPCIDMWLYSHSNCPLCRADTPVHHVVSGVHARSIGNINR